MKIFITGATGYIGHQLALKAAEKGYSVHALVRNLISPFCPQDPNIRLFSGDVTRFDTVTEAMQGCDAVIHTAALTRLWSRQPSEFYRINVGGTRNVLQAAFDQGIHRFVLTSSCSVIGPSNSPADETHIRTTAFENDYEISKYCAEELLKEYARRGLFAVIVAPSRVFGPGIATTGNPINDLICRTINRGIAFMPAKKEVVGNYAFIDDVVEGHFRALRHGLGGQKYIVGGENISYEVFFRTIADSCDRKVRIVPVTKLILKAWSYASYAMNCILGKETHLTPKLVDRLLENRALNCNRAIRQLHYSVTPFNVGIARTIQFLKLQHYEK